MKDFKGKEILRYILVALVVILLYIAYDRIVVKSGDTADEPAPIQQVAVAETKPEQPAAEQENEKAEETENSVQAENAAKEETPAQVDADIKIVTEESDAAEAEAITEEPQDETEEIKESEAEIKEEPEESAITETPAAADTPAVEEIEQEETLDEHGAYTTKNEVAFFIHTYGRLPDNYITKKEAEDLGWVSTKGNLWQVAPGMSIGGSRFGNYEGILPKAKGRTYYECDIDYKGKKRNAKRIVYSNDGLIFYTEDHYETFEQLY